MAKHTRKRISKRSYRNKKHRGGEGNVAKKNNNAVEAPAVDPVEPAVEPAVEAVEAAPASEGGRRKTRKVSKGASDWNKKVMMVYREMKKKDPSVKLGAAMKECSKRKKRGEL